MKTRLFWHGKRKFVWYGFNCQYLSTVSILQQLGFFTWIVQNSSCILLGPLLKCSWFSFQDFATACNDNSEFRSNMQTKQLRPDERGLPFILAFPSWCTTCSQWTNGCKFPMASFSSETMHETVPVRMTCGMYCRKHRRTNFPVKLFGQVGPSRSWAVPRKLGRKKVEEFR